MTSNYKEIQEHWHEWPEKTRLRWTAYIQLLANLSDEIQDASTGPETDLSRQARSGRVMLEQHFQRIHSNGRFRTYDPGRGPGGVAAMIEMPRFSTHRSSPVYQALQNYLDKTDIDRPPTTVRKPTLETLMHAQSVKRQRIWQGVSQEIRNFCLREDGPRYPLANREWPRWVRDEWEEYQFTVFHLETFAATRNPFTNMDRNDTISKNRNNAAELAAYLRERGGYQLDSRTKFTKGGPGAKAERIQAEARALAFRSLPDPDYNKTVRELGETLRDYYSFMSDTAREHRQRPR